MVLNVKPVAHVLALAINREGLAVPNVIDEQRNQFLRELVGAVVVGAIGHNSRHAEGVVESADKMIRRGLRRGIRAVRLIIQVLREELLTISEVMLSGRSLRGERRLDALRVRHLQRAVDLVGRDVVEPLFFPISVPRCLSGLKHRQRAHHIGLRKGERVFDGAVHMRLGRKVDDAVHMLLLHEFQYAFEIADIHFHEPVVRLVFDIAKVGEVACIGELVEIDYPVVRILVHKEPHDVRADESGSAGDNDASFHILSSVPIVSVPVPVGILPAGMKIGRERPCISGVLISGSIANDLSVVPVIPRPVHDRRQKILR